MSKPHRRFTLTTAIQARRALNIRARFFPLTFGQRMHRLKTEKTITAAFRLS